MKIETKIRNALISLYWEAHKDGHDGINSVERRARAIKKALQNLNAVAKQDKVAKPTRR